MEPTSEKSREISDMIQMIVYFPNKNTFSFFLSFSLFCVVWKFYDLKNIRNNFIEVSLKLHEVSLLLSFTKFRKISAMKLPNHSYTVVYMTLQGI